MTTGNSYYRFGVPRKPDLRVPLTCEVCEIERAVGVASVPGIPISAAYCRTCLIHGADPWPYVKANIICCGGPQNMVREYIYYGMTYYDRNYVTILKALHLDPIKPGELDMSPPIPQEETKDEDTSHLG